MKMLVQVQNFTIPKNWNPKEPEAVKKWLDKLPIPYDLKKCMEADEKHNDLKILNGL